MSDLADTVSEAVERAHDGGPRQGLNLNTVVAISAAITATFIAVCNVKDGNIVQAMQQVWGCTQASWRACWAD